MNLTLIHIPALKSVTIGHVTLDKMIKYSSQNELCIWIHVYFHSLCSVLIGILVGHCKSWDKGLVVVGNGELSKSSSAYGEGF